VKKTVRILTLHYYPDYASAALLMEELANGLKEMNFNVDVLTSQPIYNKEKKDKEFDNCNGVNIFRVSSLGLNKNLKMVKILNSIWFFLSICSKVLFFEDGKNVIYLLTSNPPILPIIGLIIKFFKGNKFVTLVYDINPDASTKLGYVSNRTFTVKLWIFLNKLVFNQSSIVIAISEQMKNYILKNYLENDFIKDEKIKIIHNWANPELIKPLNKDKNIFIKRNNLQNKFIINYSGNIGIAQKFDGLLNCALLLKKEKDIAFIFFGNGVKKKSIVNFVENNRLTNFYFQDYQPKQILQEVLSTSDLSVVHLEKEVEGLSMPSKLYCILASGRPVLAFCDKNSDLGKIIIESKCGFVVSHNEPEKIVNIILELKENRKLHERLSFNGRNYFLKHFTLEKAIRKYYQIFSII
jgi:colanic acid biosynthesis glycosyl transferase WcaI